MKAIVLSCDKYHPLADHMIQSYQEIWPSHPFLFRVPYQQFPTNLNNKYTNKIELIKTPPDIKQTVLTLIDDLAAEDWIYWCIDDKYLVEINETAVNNCVKWVSKISDPMDCGVMFCRCRKLLDLENLRHDCDAVSAYGNEYIQRKNYYQFWIPQFLRVKILRELFQEFPDSPFKAKEMDAFTGQNPGLTVKKLRKDQRMHVSKINNARFGESTIAGVITKNCFTSMQLRNISAFGFRKLPFSRLIGEM